MFVFALHAYISRVGTRVKADLNRWTCRSMIAVSYTYMGVPVSAAISSTAMPTLISYRPPKSSTHVCSIARAGSEAQRDGWLPEMISDYFGRDKLLPSDVSEPARSVPAAG